MNFLPFCLPHSLAGVNAQINPARLTGRKPCCLRQSRKSKNPPNKNKIFAFAFIISYLLLQKQENTPFFEPQIASCTDICGIKSRPERNLSRDGLIFLLMVSFVVDYGVGTVNLLAQYHSGELVRKRKP